MAGSIQFPKKPRIPAMNRAPMTCSASERWCTETLGSVAGNAALIVSFSPIVKRFQVSSTLGLATNHTRAAVPNIAGFGLWRMMHNLKGGKSFQSGHSLGRCSVSALTTLPGGTMGGSTLRQSVTRPLKNFSRASGLSISAFDPFISQSDNHRISKSTYQGRHCPTCCGNSKFQSGSAKARGAKFRPSRDGGYGHRANTQGRGGPTTRPAKASQRQFERKTAVSATAIHF